MLAEVIFQDRREMEDKLIEAVVYRVEKSKKYPEGSRYSFQSHQDGKTIVRYDNYNKHSDSRHHKHLGEKRTEALENKPKNKKDIVELYKKFLQEVKEYND